MYGRVMVDLIFYILVAIAIGSVIAKKVKDKKR
jgi:hypothetical protein